jgi:hypothetical protein
LAVAAVEGVQAATGAGGTASESGANIEHNKCRWPTPYDALLMRKGLKRPLPTPQPHPWPLALLPTRDFVPVTLQSPWHAITRNWPVFSLRDYSVAAKSASAWGLRMRVAGLAALTAATK